MSKLTLTITIVSALPFNDEFAQKIFDDVTDFVSENFCEAPARMLGDDCRHKIDRPYVPTGAIE